MIKKTWDVYECAKLIHCKVFKTEKLEQRFVIWEYKYGFSEAHKCGWTGFCFVKKYDPFDPDFYNLRDLVLSAV